MIIIHRHISGALMFHQTVSEGAFSRDWIQLTPETRHFLVWRDLDIHIVRSLNLQYFDQVVDNGAF